MIHPTAIIAPGARLDPDVEVGPYAVIDAGVELGPGCRVGPFVHITGLTTVGSRNTFDAGCVIGGAPQDLKYKGEPTRLRIGDNNVFREHVTVNRSNKPEEDTVVGSGNFLMQHAHVAHNAIVGDYAILGGGALVAGHAHVADRAFVSGNCLVHQFCRVGTLALMQGGSAVSKDLPPYVMVREVNQLCGLNIIGLRRAGIPADERLALKAAYRTLFRSGLPWKEALARLAAAYPSGPVQELVRFIQESHRGVCFDRRRLAGAAPEEAETA